MERPAMPPVVLWLDPGGTTGFAWLIDGREFHAAQARGTLEAGDLVAQLAQQHRADLAVGWEAYLVPRGGRITGTPGPALEVIGATRWIAHRYGCRVLPAVPAASRTRFTTRMLRQINWTPKGEHALAASQHLLAWCQRNGQLTESLRALYTTVGGGYDVAQETR